MPDDKNETFPDVVRLTFYHDRDRGRHHLVFYNPDEHDAEEGIVVGVYRLDAKELVRLKRYVDVVAKEP